MLRNINRLMKEIDTKITPYIENTIIKIPPNTVFKKRGYIEEEFYIKNKETSAAGSKQKKLKDKAESVKQMLQNQTRNTNV